MKPKKNSTISEQAITVRNDSYLMALNEKQREAVEYTEGPLLVLAGAGTGKTRALTTRLSHILNKKLARPNEILAVTFTNKAAREMKRRIEDNVRGVVEGMPWIGTFHSLCAKILRTRAELAGLNNNFTILDTDDQLRLMKQLIKAANMDEKRWPPRLLMGIIDSWKNRAIFPDKIPETELSFFNSRGQDFYEQYQYRLKTLNAVDFGDLILHVVKIFKSNSEILRNYQNKFKYILVDEYQDTNVAQYLWLRLLAASHKNICCVGDDDQSIYSWRGAEIKNFLEFDKVYKDTKIIRLEKNYRSTQNILSVASKLIENNQNRVGKTLFTSHDNGDLVSLSCFRNVKDEATEVGSEIEKLKKKYSLNEVAILVRAIFQTREFEERFLKIGLPYRIVGGIKFYERAEIKDCVAYLRTIHQPFDDLSFERIINVPKRSIGDTTIKNINEYAKKNKISLEISARKLIEENKIKPKTKLGLSSLLNLLEKWRSDLKNKVNHNKLLQLVLDESGYSEMLKNKKDLENENRLENIKELLNAMKEFDNLESFLEHVALATSLDQDWESEKVNLMTMHASKGLEFDVVFLPGWEEGLFPHQKSIEEKGESGLEEERRLAYVGITRAKKIAKISFSMNRFYQGDWIDSMASRFIDELPDEHLKKNNNFIEENVDDFEFNQDIDFDEPVRSPGWLRYQKKLNDK